MFPDFVGKISPALKKSACVPSLTISTLKTMQFKDFGQNMLKLRTAIQNLAKERLVKRVDPDVLKKRERLIQKSFVEHNHK